MYLKKSLILQSGPIEDFEIDLEFRMDGHPKPLVVVGQNGSGKTNFLSFITDALIETASKKFADVAPVNPSGVGHQWHRVIGGPTIRTGSQYELAVLEFSHGDESKIYVSKGGQLPSADVAERIAGFPNLTWPEQGSHKEITGRDETIESIFRSGCYVSFPTGRVEEAYWAGRSDASDSSAFTDRFGNLPLFNGVHP